MKKSLIIFCLFIIFNVNIQALKIKFIDDNFITTLNWKIKRIYVDNKLSFCIQPSKTAGTLNYTKKDFKKQYASLSASKKDKIKKLGLVGESMLNEAKKNNNKKYYYYYYAAQELIWDQVNSKKYRFKINLTAYRNNITKQVNNFNKLSVHHNKTYTIKSGQSKSYTDILLADFTLKNKADFEQQSGVKVTLNKDKITFTNPNTNKKESSYKLIMTKFKNKYSTGTSLVYINSTLQDFVKVNNDFKIEMNINIRPELSQGKMEGYKVSETQKPLEDAVFGYFQDGKQLGTMKSDNKGYFSSPLLLVGTYQVKEISAPERYKLNNTVYTVVIKDNTTTKINDGNEIVNKLKRGSFKMLKKDEDNEVIKGVVFGLYNQNRVLIDELTSDENGLITKDNLIFGHYYLKEHSTPDQYILDSKLIALTIDGEELIELEDFINYYDDHKIIIIKVDNITGKKLTGAKFIIESSDHKIMDTFELNKKQLIINNLKPKCYIIKEIKAPKGYLLDKNKQQQVCLTDVKKKEILFKNEKIKQAVLRIEKYDEDTKEVLVNTEFIVQDKRQKIIKKTNKNGYIELNLDEGCYLVSETQASAGYIKKYQNKQVCLKAGQRKIEKFYNKKMIKIKAGIKGNSTTIFYLLIAVTFSLWLGRKKYK